MATGTAGTSARIYPWQLEHYLRKSVAYNTAGIGTDLTVTMGILPAGAFITKILVRIDTVFNAVSTNVLTVGTTTGSNNLVASGDVDEGTAATTVVTTGNGLSITSDSTVYVRYTQTGTAATAGAATIVICYVLNNDG